MKFLKKKKKTSTRWPTTLSIAVHCAAARGPEITARANIRPLLEARTTCIRLQRVLELRKPLLPSVREPHTRESGIAAAAPCTPRAHPRRSARFRGWEGLGTHLSPRNARTNSLCARGGRCTHRGVCAAQLDPRGEQDGRMK